MPWFQNDQCPSVPILDFHNRSESRQKNNANKPAFWLVNKLTDGIFPLAVDDAAALLKVIRFGLLPIRQKTARNAASVVMLAAAFDRRGRVCPWQPDAPKYWDFLPQHYSWKETIMSDDDDDDPDDMLDLALISEARDLAASAAMLLEHPRMIASHGLNSGLYREAVVHTQLILFSVQLSEQCANAEEFDVLLYLICRTADSLALALSLLRIP